jgi:outer membrane protein OmpA-like peptidoglycan-associated protein
MAKQLATHDDGNKSSVPPPVPKLKPAQEKIAKGTAPGDKVRIDAVKVKSAARRIMATRIEAPGMPKAEIAETPSTSVPGSGAVPPPHVTGDHVMNKMMNMDKDRVMAGIEDAVKRTNKLPGARHLSDKDALVIHGTGTTAIVGAGHLMRQTSKGHAIIAPSDGEPGAEGVSDTAAPLRPKDKTASIQIPTPPPEADYKRPGYISITYDKSQLGLNDSLQADINGRVLPLLKKEPGARLQIQAYASDSGENHNSRQRSLARGLAVREYLIDQGISQDRLDIHAMGMQSDRDPLDRVDFVIISPAGAKKL